MENTLEPSDPKKSTCYTNFRVISAFTIFGRRSLLFSETLKMCVSKGFWSNQLSAKKKLHQNFPEGEVIFFKKPTFFQNAYNLTLFLSLGDVKSNKPMRKDTKTSRTEKLKRFQSVEQHKVNFWIFVYKLNWVFQQQSLPCKWYLKVIFKKCKFLWK